MLQVVQSSLENADMHNRRRIGTNLSRTICFNVLGNMAIRCLSTRSEVEQFNRRLISTRKLIACKLIGRRLIGSFDRLERSATDNDP